MQTKQTLLPNMLVKKEAIQITKMKFCLLQRKQSLLQNTYYNLLLVGKLTHQMLGVSNAQGLNTCDNLCLTLVLTLNKKPFI